MAHDLKSIMQTAHRILNDRRGYCTMSDALRMSWLIAKGFDFGFELTLSTGERRIVGASSRDDAGSKLRAMQWAVVNAGGKYLGSVEFNLKIYAPVAAVVSVPAEVMALAA